MLTSLLLSVVINITALFICWMLTSSASDLQKHHTVLLTYKDTHSVLLIQESSNRECFAYRINNETILVQCWSNPATDVDRHRHCAWVAPVTNHSLVINMKVYTVYELCTSCASDPSISGNRRGWHRHRVWAVPVRELRTETRHRWIHCATDQSQCGNRHGKTLCVISVSVQS